MAGEGGVPVDDEDVGQEERRKAAVALRQLHVKD